MASGLWTTGLMAVWSKELTGNGGKVALAVGGSEAEAEHELRKWTGGGLSLGNDCGSAGGWNFDVLLAKGA